MPEFGKAHLVVAATDSIYYEARPAYTTIDVLCSDFRFFDFRTYFFEKSMFKFSKNRF